MERFFELAQQAFDLTIAHRFNAGNLIRRKTASPAKEGKSAPVAPEGACLFLLTGAGPALKCQSILGREKIRLGLATMD
jgi:hypothetical protein